MAADLINVHSKNQGTNFFVEVGKRAYKFHVPDQAILDHLRASADEINCRKFVEEKCDFFGKIAEEFISRESERTEFLIGLDTLQDYFQ